MEGWISLYRKFIDWEWYTDINVKIVFIHLLLLANHTKNIWKGVEIQRGQLITSSEHLAKDLNLSRQQVRTALCKLQSTNEITTKSTNKYMLITIEKYNDYQDSLRKNNQQNNQQNNNQITTNNNDNKYINLFINNKESDFVPFEEGDEISEWLKTKGINSVEEYMELDSSKQDELMEEWFTKGK